MKYCLSAQKISENELGHSPHKFEINGQWYSLDSPEKDIMEIPFTLYTQMEDLLKKRVRGNSKLAEVIMSLEETEESE